MAVSNVALTNTFDQWRLVTNQLAIIANDILDDGRQTYRNLIANVATSNTIIANTITVSGMNVQPLLNATFSQANAAFDKANTANVVAVAAFGQANISSIAFGQANAGYSQANTANVVAVAAFGQANISSIAFGQANTANVVAVAAFNAANTGTPAGVIMPYAGSTEPSGWLFCSGNAVSRTTYSGLFSVIGTTYGVGDNSTTFNLPDLQGRSIFGRDNMSGTTQNRINSHSSMTGTTLGNTGGTQTHTLTTAQMPAHTHGLTTSSDITSGSPTAPSQGILADTSSGTPTDSTGGGERHQNMPPAMILNFIIKT